MILVLLVVAVLLNSKAATSSNAQPEPVTTVRFVPSSLAVEPNQTFTLAMVVEDVVDLVGFDVQFGWNATCLAFINHTLTVPIESYQSPISPSPYAGILHDPAFVLEDQVNVTVGTYWGAAANLEINGFTGNGTIITITLKALSQLGSTFLQFTNHELVAPEGEAIPNKAINSSVNVWRIHVSIISPENKTYSMNSFPLTFNLSKPASWIGYSLDGKENTTISGNTTLSGLSNGVHSLVVYARDFSENTGASSMLHFSIEQVESEPFPVEIIAAVLTITAAIATGLVYFVRLKRKKEVRKP